MSKKNRKSTRRNLHAYDLEKERQEQEQKAKQAAKKASKLTSPDGAIKKDKKKNKTFRIRKGVRVQGLVVRDSESKKKALKLLAAREALKMDVDEGNGKKERKRIRVGGGGVKLKQAMAIQPKGTARAPKAGKAAPPASDQMDVE